MIYFDSCYLAKFYLAEPDSARVTAFAQAQGRVACLVIGRAEVVSVFHRKFRECVVDERGFHLLCDQFESDCASGLGQWIPMDDGLLRGLARRVRSLPMNTFLRTADALHLTCAAELGFSAVHTSDRHMVAAAPAFGLQAVTT